VRDSAENHAGGRDIAVRQSEFLLCLCERLLAMTVAAESASQVFERIYEGGVKPPSRLTGIRI